MYKRQEIISLFAGISAGILLSSTIALAATTISTSIITGGNITTTNSGALTVSGLSTMTGGFVSAASSTVVGLSNMSGGFVAVASSTVVGLTNMTGGFVAVGSSTVVGLSNMTGGFVAVGSSTVVGLTNMTGGFISVASSTVVGLANLGGGAKITGVASSTSVRVGSDTVTDVSGMIFGHCLTPGVGSFAASTTQYVTCTPIVTTTSLNTNYRVFVQATSSLSNSFVIQAASTTSTGVIRLKIMNVGYSDGTTVTALASDDINFWAVR